MLVLEHIYNACEDGDGEIFVLHGDGDGLQSTPLGSILSTAVQMNHQGIKRKPIATRYY